jgi:hypothetical protein
VNFNDVSIERQTARVIAESFEGVGGVAKFAAQWTNDFVLKIFGDVSGSGNGQ